MKRRITAMLLALLCTASVFSTSVISKAEVIRETTLEDYILKEMSSAHVLGLGVSIVSDEKELYCAGYGMAQKTESDYVLGDLTKTLTAAGIMRLVEDSELSLEDTVADCTSSYAGYGELTIRQLLNQTSGIAYKQAGQDSDKKGKEGKFEDANLNYTILGDIIESVSGMAYEEYISDNVLDPLEMDSTYSMRHDAEMGEEMLPGYQSYFGFPFSKKYKYAKDDSWMTVSSSYMVSDVKDMGKYLQMYLQKGGDVLSKESVKKMLASDVEVGKSNATAKALFGGQTGYGMGWYSKEVDGEAICYSFGKTENYTTVLVLLPKKKLGIAMMFNSSDTLVGQRLIEKLVEGVVSIEMGNTPEKLNSNTYLVRHGIYDALMVFAVIAALLPIFLLGKWWKRRNQKLFSVTALVIDILVNIVLPTVLLILLLIKMPPYIALKFTPDVFYVACAVIGCLYLGALIKVIAGIVLAIKGPKPEIAEEDEKAEPEDEKVSEEDEKVEPEDEKASEEDEKVEPEDEKASEDTQEEPESEETSVEEETTDKEKEEAEAKEADSEEQK